MILLAKRIRRRFRLILGAVVFGWSSAASAFCLNGFLSLEQEYQSSSTVLVGRVLSEKFTPETKNHLEGTTYSVRVEEMFHGSAIKTIKLFSENSSGRFPMKVGTAYLIFVHKELDWSAVDNCGNSGELSKRSEAIAKLRKMKG